MKKEATPRHIIKLVGGLLDGSDTPIYEDNICYILCVLNYETKIGHYYHLMSQELVADSGIKYCKMWYQFWISEEFTKENQQYLEDHSDDYEEIKDFLDEQLQKMDPPLTTVHRSV